MVDDKRKEVSIQKVGNTFSRLFGLLALFLASLTLILNEVKSSGQSMLLSEGSEQVLSINVDDPIDAFNDGKLVHISGVVMTTDTVHDRMFGVEAEAIKLKRDVEMYQWQERTDVSTQPSNSRRSFFVLEWGSEPVAKTDTQHKNPNMPFFSETFYAEDVRLGEYSLAFKLLQEIKGWRDVVLDEVTIPPEYLVKTRHIGNMLYMGDDPSSPELGDLRVTFRAVEPMPISIIAMQSDGLLRPFMIGSEELSLVETGEKSAEEMFQSEESSNTSTRWTTRFVGLIFMFLAAFFLRPQLMGIARRLSRSDAIGQMDIKLSTLLLGIVLSLIVILLGWVIAYAPFMGYLLLAALLGVALQVLVGKRSRSKSLLARILFASLILVIVLIVIAIIAFVYLTRAEM